MKPRALEEYFTRNGYRHYTITPIRLNGLNLLSTIKVAHDITETTRRMFESPLEEYITTLIYRHPTDNSEFTFVLRKFIENTQDVFIEPNLEEIEERETPRTIIQITEDKNPVTYGMVQPVASLTVAETNYFNEDIFFNSLLNLVTSFVEDYNTWFLREYGLSR